MEVKILEIIENATAKVLKSMELQRIPTISEKIIAEDDQEKGWIYKVIDVHFSDEGTTVFVAKEEPLGDFAVRHLGLKKS